ncbi:hypothetical protein [Dysgonomonas sp. 520]|uniref:hypothetical protein n=1 Tax=Dysgonomonas sp. 520 TaxID=2302931 RepID=UPI0013CFF03F|nr:hypothetical protein [Dysgonomonas sp. 520]NDW09337.1 hypothetical protein [Dysgonomonas sp. 520]
MEKSQLLDKSYKQLRIFYFVNLAILLAGFALVVLNKPASNNEYVAVQQLFIILTIAGIPSALKLFYWQLKKILNTDNINRYKSIYCIRIAILDFLFVVNLVSLYITGIMNFSYMAIITIFALFFCLPNEDQLEMVMYREPEMEDDETESEELED